MFVEKMKTWTEWRKVLLADQETTATVSLEAEVMNAISDTGLDLELAAIEVQRGPVMTCVWGFNAVQHLRDTRTKRHSPRQSA